MKTADRKRKRAARTKPAVKPTVDGVARGRRGGKVAATIDILSLLAIRAFGQGFLAGADPRRALRRHSVEASTHEHWRRGFDAGRDAISEAEFRYGMGLKRSANRASRPR
jgi:hypothetical protein